MDMRRFQIPKNNRSTKKHYNHRLERHMRHRLKNEEFVAPFVCKPSAIKLPKSTTASTLEVKNYFNNQSQRNTRQSQIHIHDNFRSDYTHGVLWLFSTLKVGLNRSTTQQVQLFAKSNFLGEWLWLTGK